MDVRKGTLCGSGCSSSTTLEVTKAVSVGRRLTVVQWQLRSSRIALTFLSILPKWCRSSYFDVDGGLQVEHNNRSSSSSSPAPSLSSSCSFFCSFSSPLLSPALRLPSFSLGPGVRRATFCSLRRLMSFIVFACFPSYVSRYGRRLASASRILRTQHNTENNPQVSRDVNRTTNGITQSFKKSSPINQQRNDDKPSCVQRRTLLLVVDSLYGYAPVA